MRKTREIRNVIYQVIRKHRLLSAAIIIAITGTIATGLIPPLALEKIVNRLTIDKQISFNIAALYFLLLVISGLFDAGKEVLITVFGQKVTRELRHEMCRKLSRLPVAYFANNESGVITSRFVNDVDTVDALFTSGIISMFVDVFKLISIMIVIFVKSLGLGILMIVVTPLLFIFTRFVQKRMLSAQIDNRIAVGKANNHIPETVDNIRMIHNLNKEKYMEDKYDNYIQEGYISMEKSNLYDAVYSPVIIVVSEIIIALMMIFAAMNGNIQSFFGMSVGTAVAIIAYVGKVFEPLENIGMEIQNIQSAVAGVKRINEYLAEDEKMCVDKSITIKELVLSGKPPVEFKNVCFGYEQDNNVLNNLNLQVNTGEMVTLTGRTGAGKSTIFKLILGFYDTVSGHVNIYGVSSSTIPDPVKRKLFGYVEQNFLMVPGTVKEQITLFDESISIDDVEEASKLVGLHESICNLENGYDTVCDSNIFSQGQWQLLSIARAIVAQPAILLLDEITANLDAETERQVMEALKKASVNRTVISISHRLYKQTGGRKIEI